MAQTNELWVADRNGNLVNFSYVISLFVGADSDNGSLKTVHVNAFDPAGTFASNGVAELTSHTDGTGMTTGDAVILLQQISALIGVYVPGPPPGSLN